MGHRLNITRPWNPSRKTCFVPCWSTVLAFSETEVYLPSTWMTTQTRESSSASLQSKLCWKLVSPLFALLVFKSITVLVTVHRRAIYPSPNRFTSSAKEIDQPTPELLLSPFVLDLCMPPRWPRGCASICKYRSEAPPFFSFSLCGAQPILFS